MGSEADLSFIVCVSVYVYMCVYTPAAVFFAGLERAHHPRPLLTALLLCRLLLLLVVLLLLLL